MLTAIGNIFLANDTRLQYLFATLRSFLFFKNNLVVYLNVENLADISQDNIDKLKNILKEFKYYELSGDKDNFGTIYSKLLSKSETKYHMHFEEDHFCVLNEEKYLSELLGCMEEQSVEICKITFFEIEKARVHSISPLQETAVGKIYEASLEGFISVNRNVASYYLGTNCIFDKQFAERYWSNSRLDNHKQTQHKPHPFELRSYTEEFKHTYMLPSQEILCAIDDDHGLTNSCLLNRDVEKFNDILI